MKGNIPILRRQMLGYLRDKVKKMSTIDSQMIHGKKKTPVCVHTHTPHREKERSSER